MKRKLILMLVAACLFGNCFAEYKCMDFRASDSGMDAYAWNEDYLFIAHGYFYDTDYLYTWESRHYSITSVNRENGETSVLFEKIDGRYVNLFIDGTTLFVIWEVPGDALNSITVLGLDVYSNIIRFISTISLTANEYLNDAVIYEECAYITTNQRIVRWDTRGMDTLYTYAGMPNNSFYNNHIIIDGDALYFQEDNFVMSLDLNTWDIRLICEIDVMNAEKGYSNYECRFKLGDWQYNYIVLDGVIYYYDVELQSTISFDMRKEEMTILSQDEIYFFCFSDDVIVYRRVMLQLDRLYGTTHVVNIAGNRSIDLIDDGEIPWDTLEDIIIPIGFGECIKPYTLKLYEDGGECRDDVIQIYSLKSIQ